MQNNKWFLSSSGSEDLALTIKGLLMLLVPSLLFVSQSFGWNWSESDITNWIILISSLISCIMLAYGVFRKVMVAIKDNI